MYAIIEDSGTQIKVSKGDVIRIALRKTSTETPAITFDRVLLVSDPAQEGSTKVGAPYLSNAKVTGEVLSQEKTDKVTSWRFKRRKNVVKRKGHRQGYLKVKIQSIDA